MSALVTPEVLEQIVERVSQQLRRLPECTLAELHLLAGEATDRAKSLERLKRAKRISEHAARAQSALERLAIRARQAEAKLLAQLSTAAPGKGAGKGRELSERTKAAKEAGLTADEARRLVKLAAVTDDDLESICKHLGNEGRRVTVHAVIKAAEAPSAAEGYDSDQWYTPANYMDAVVEVLGAIDEDPASCAVGQMGVKARRWWSASEPVLGPAELAAGITPEGFAELLKTHAGVGTVLDTETGEVIVEDLKLPAAKRARKYAREANAGRLCPGSRDNRCLRGRVFCNPPYSFPAPFIRAVLEGYLGAELEEIFADWTRSHGDEGSGLTNWQTRAVGHRAAKPRTWDTAGSPVCGPTGPILEAILLVNVATATWIQQMALAAASAVCLPSSRIAFLDAHGVAKSGNRYEQVIIYLGPRPDRFAAVFRDFGLIWSGFKGAS